MSPGPPRTTSAARVAGSRRRTANRSKNHVILRLIAQRLSLAVGTLLVVSALVFFFTSVLPGDIAERVLGRESTAEQRQIFRAHLHLGEPVWERYGVWIGVWRAVTWAARS